jgi:hypothetical protein
VPAFGFAFMPAGGLLMTIDGVQSALVGFSMFDVWAASMNRVNHTHKHGQDPLVHAAFQAFEGYLQTQEAMHTAMIAGAAYTLNAQGSGAQLITNQQLAPLLALNILA